MDIHVYKFRQYDDPTQYVVRNSHQIWASQGGDFIMLEYNNL
jgi:hypothetical protein